MKLHRAAALGILAFTNLLVAFLTQWYVVAELGAGAETDALFAGMAVPQLALAVISGSLMHVLVPLLAGEDVAKMRRDGWTLISFISALFALAAVALGLTASWWVPLTVPGFSREAQELTVTLVQIQLTGMIFAAANGVQWAFNHAREHFIFAESIPVATGIVSFAALAWVLPKYGVAAAAWIGTLRLLLQTLLLSHGMGPFSKPDFRAPIVRETWERIRPLLLGSALYKTDPLVDRILLSITTSGTLSLYYLAQQLFAAGTQVLNRALGAPLVPRLSILFKMGNVSGAKDVYKSHIQAVLVLSSTSLLALFLLESSALYVMQAIGRLSVEDAKSVYSIMLYLSGVFLGGALGQISSSTFYASGDTTTPTRIGVVSYCIYVPAKIFAFLSFGVFGLAISTSVFWLTNFLMQHYVLRRDWRHHFTTVKT